MLNEKLEKKVDFLVNHIPLLILLSSHLFQHNYKLRILQDKHFIFILLIIFFNYKAK